MKKSNFSVIYFILIFALLYYGFYGYIGLSTPGGKIYSPFLYRYLNFPDWLSIAVVKTTLVLLKIAGYSVYQKSPFNITITGGHGANIAWGCIGIGVTVLWFAFIMAHRARFIYKLKWIAAGIALIYLFNAVRIAAIILSYQHHWRYMQSFNAHATFNNITYVIIIILMLIYIRNYNHTEGKRFSLA